MIIWIIFANLLITIQQKLANKANTTTTMRSFKSGKMSLLWLWNNSVIWKTVTKTTLITDHIENLYDPGIFHDFVSVHFVLHAGWGVRKYWVHTARGEGKESIFLLTCIVLTVQTRHFVTQRFCINLLNIWQMISESLNVFAFMHVSIS